MKKVKRIRKIILFGVVLGMLGVVGSAEAGLFAKLGKKPAASAPQSGKILKSIYFSNQFGTVFDSASQGRYVYAAGGYGLGVLDFSKPSAPKLVKKIKTPLELSDIVIEGSKAYVAAGKRSALHGQLIIFDIANPANPRQIGVLELEQSPIGIVVQNGIAYLGGYSSGLFIVDVKNPSHPRLLSTFALQNPERNEAGKIDRLLQLDQNIQKAIIAKKGKAFGIQNEQDAKRWAELRRLKGHVWWPNVRRSHAYVPYDPEGLYIVDVSDPARPRQVGHFNKKSPTGGDYYFNDVAFYGDYAFVALDYAGFLVLDISDPANPREVAHVDPWPGSTWENAPGHMIQVKVIGDRAYFPAGEAGVYIYDIRNPRAPKLIEKTTGSLAANKGLAWGLETTDQAIVVGYIPFKTNSKAKGGLEIYQIQDV